MLNDFHKFYSNSTLGAESGNTAMTIAANETVVIPKASTDIIFGAHGDLKLSKVQKPRN